MHGYRGWRASRRMEVGSNHLHDLPITHEVNAVGQERNRTEVVGDVDVGWDHAAREYLSAS